MPNSKWTRLGIVFLLLLVGIFLWNYKSTAPHKLPGQEDSSSTPPLSAGPAKYTIDELFDKIPEVGERLGVNIRFANPATAIEMTVNPESGERRPTGFTTESFNQAMSSVIIESLERVAETYPQGSFGALCNTIYVTKAVSISGYKLKERSDEAWIVLPAPKNPLNKQNYDAQLAITLGAIHHELSSFIWHTQPTLQTNWQKTLPINWEVLGEKARKMGAAIGTFPNPDTGYLSFWSEVSAENDYNIYAEFVFGNPEDLITLAKEHDIIAQKLSLFIQSYEDNDPRFADYFKTSGLKDASQ